MSLRIRFQYPTGSKLGYSIERMSDGLLYDFTSSSFVATPTTPITTLPEDSGIFLGRYKLTLNPTPVSQFTDGDYAVTVHDQASANNVVAELATTMHAGDDVTVIPQPIGTAVDPWSVTLPGSYVAGSAGAILGKNLDAQVSTRSTYAGGVDPWSVTLPGSYAAGSAGAILGKNLDAQVSTRSTYAGGVDPWSVTLPGSYAAGSAGAIFGKNLDAQVSTRSTYSGGAVASVTAPVTVGVNNDKAGYLLAASGLDAIQVEGGINARQALSPILAACAGVVAGAGTGVVVIKGGNSSSTRITATTDNAGNRSSVTLALPT